MVTANKGRIEIDLGEELMEKLNAITEERRTTPEDLIQSFILDYIVSGGHPMSVVNNWQKD